MLIFHAQDRLRTLIKEFERFATPSLVFGVLSVLVLSVFACSLHAVDSRERFEALTVRYGLMRSNHEIWINFEWFIDHMRTKRPLEAGIYGLIRYSKIADLTSAEAG